MFFWVVVQFAPSLLSHFSEHGQSWVDIQRFETLWYIPRTIRGDVHRMRSVKTITSSIVRIRESRKRRMELSGIINDYLYVTGE